MLQMRKMYKNWLCFCKNTKQKILSFGAFSLNSFDVTLDYVRGRH